MQVEATQNTATQPYYSAKSIETAIENVYAKRTPFSGTTNIIDAQNMQNILNGLSTNYSTIDNLQPTDISFEDYTKLTYSALEVLFNGDGSKVGPASGLMASSHMSEDKILNEIIFDNAIETYGTEETSMQSILFKSFPPKLETHHFDSVAFSPDDNSYLANLARDNRLHTNSELNDKDTSPTKQTFFKSFDKLMNLFEQKINNWTSSNDKSELIKTMDKIKSLYKQKVEENNAMLENYTKNSKPNILHASI